ncbi:hypothetical protein C8J57DRAFT_1277036 [Mycena rebaudengoi]|nr:hypothetical protein C8J57DRAFT_1277036 [Mycena rebaudengoi]
MPPTPEPFDLKQVGALFSHCISVIRDENKSVNLEPLAIEWLRNARHDVMRQIEKQYYALANSRGKPLLQQPWAVDPSTPLVMLTPVAPHVLQPYFPAFRDNLFQLLKDCGFHSEVTATTSTFLIYIRFPRQLGNDDSSEIPHTLHIDDEFSRTAGGDAGSAIEPSLFMGSAFGRLLTAPSTLPGADDPTQGDPSLDDGSGDSTET